MHPEDPKTLAAIKDVVLILLSGDQPPDGMNMLPAVDHEYAEVKPWPSYSEGFPGLQLTWKGLKAGTQWRLENGPARR